ncbi:monoamine oxidase [Sinobacterium caligoides]|uniref:Tryptophan 2-monooxygenase n=1 Tax=Sinobacterium caligoides TaxID=933926 RepID=A0A3N2DNB8_9GAMM|nr:FAD-dependent oxidoreductase [Sinobacterium caligoides]ROS01304.1 monoamine oxidase [Sinobacterium caligoides]
MDKSRRKFIGQFAVSALSAKALLGQSALADQSIDNPSLESWRDRERNRHGDRHTEVLILGAGISGLVAAYELTKAGYNCRILEARDRPGGRNETIRHGSVIKEFDREDVCQFSRDKSVYFNSGAGRISQRHTRLLGYCRELGVEMETFVNDNYTATYRMNEGYGGKPVPFRQLHASQRGLIASTLAQAIDQSLVDDLIEPYNVEQMLAMLKTFGDLQQDYTYQGSTRAGIVEGTGILSPAEPIEGVDFSDFMAAEDPWSQMELAAGERIDYQPNMLQPVGGMDKIPYAFAKRLRRRIQYESVVSKIERSGEGGTVTYTQYGRERAISADHIIVTIPLTVLQGIEHDFSEDISSAIDGAFYAPPGKVAFESERFWESEESIYGGVSYMESENSAIWYPSGDYNAKTGSLGCGYIYWGINFANMDNYQRNESALSQVEKTHPNIRQHARHGCSRSWKNTPFSEGGWSNVPPAPAFSHADGPYVFAGDHTTYLSGWQEGAVLSAHRAIEIVAQLVEAKQSLQAANL